MNMKWMIAIALIALASACPGEPEEEPVRECETDYFQPYCEGGEEVYCDSECGTLLAGCETFIRTRAADRCVESDVGFDVGIDDSSDMGTEEDLGSDDMGATGDSGPSADTGAPVDATAEVLAEVNAARSVEQMCGHQMMGPVPELIAVVELAEAAQGHADDMATTGQLTFEGSDGSTTNDRVAATGWGGMAVNESISSGQVSAAQVVASFMASEGTCQNLMNASATGLGAGYAEGDSNLSPFWSIVLGAE